MNLLIVVFAVREYAMYMFWFSPFIHTHTHTHTCTHTHTHTHAHTHMHTHTHTHTQWKQLSQRERRKVSKCPHTVTVVPGV